MEFALAGPVIVISWIIVTCIAYIINQIFFFKSNFFLHNILVSWFYAITITLSPTYSPILCPPRWSLPLLGCVMWGLMSSVIDLSVSQSARWLQLLSLTVCVTSDWVTPACWSCRLQAVDKRVELLTGRFRRDRQQDGAELTDWTALNWFLPLRCEKTEKHWPTWVSPGYRGGRAHLSSAKCYREVRERREESLNMLQWVTICSMFVSPRWDWREN